MSDPLLPDPTDAIEVSPQSVAAWISLPAAERPRLIDCREADELDLCRIEGQEWIPMQTIPHQLQALAADSERGIVIYCHHGMRSLHAAHFLRGHGLKNAYSMSGGIDAWSREIDPAVPRY